jgi:hypothetical protein
MTAAASPTRPSSMTARLKAFAVNSLLVLVSLLLSYLVGDGGPVRRKLTQW